jgi:hypothetical protein
LRCSYCNRYLKLEAQYCYYCSAKLEPAPIACASGRSEADDESTEAIGHDSNHAPLSTRSGLGTIGAVVGTIGMSLNFLAVASSTGGASQGWRGAVVYIAVGLILIVFLWFLDSHIDRHLSQRNLAGQVGAALDTWPSVEPGWNPYCGQENTLTMGVADNSFGCGSDGSGG